MPQNAVTEAIKHFLKTTTLHGFKYLCSAFYADRIGWLLCCCASACCAGVLCAVLWERFLEVPALLTISDSMGGNKYMDEKMPSVIVCPSTVSMAEEFLDKLSTNKTATERIPITLERLLAGKLAAEDQLELLNDLLIENELDLSEVIMKYTPNCKEHTKRCRYMSFIVPCDQLFEKELTSWGMCCVMRPKKLKNYSRNLVADIYSTEILELVLQCSQGDKSHACQFVTVYDSEENLKPSMLMPGNYYMAQLRFIAIPENPSTENLVESSCIADKEYSRTFCLLRCAEKLCGCKDPFHPTKDQTRIELPKCQVTQMSCVRTNTYKKNITCNCLPSCKKITTFMSLVSNPMNYLDNTVDPLFAGLKTAPSAVINLRINLGHSRIFVLNPTETWLTLLSSLGGVFNMFLGVGLFSALELLYLILVKLPMAIKKSSEIDPTAKVTAAPVYRY